ncbi:hypothetical protein [Nitrobacter sp. TKz-YC02]|uniref:hypothetical protein n=1 Tax=Nitrobacter sp. TKz-YC02 TaxID=3398704 RepID=UPI003CEB6413
MTELSPLLGLLFDDASITFDDKSTLPHAIRRNGQEENVDLLSGGMQNIARQSSRSCDYLLAHCLRVLGLTDPVA